MGRRLIETLVEVIEAERIAASLREVHGASAEAHCAAMAEGAAGEAERERLADVKRALRWV
jgi:hypothetical protein